MYLHAAATSNSVRINEGLQIVFVNAHAAANADDAEFFLNDPPLNGPLVELHAIGHLIEV